MDKSDTGMREMLVTLTADIVSAHVSNSPVEVSEISQLVSSVHAALWSLGEPVTVSDEPLPERLGELAEAIGVERDRILGTGDGDVGRWRIDGGGAKALQSGLDRSAVPPCTKSTMCTARQPRVGN